MMDNETITVNSELLLKAIDAWMDCYKPDKVSQLYVDLAVIYGIADNSKPITIKRSLFVDFLNSLDEVVEQSNIEETQELIENLQKELK